MMSGQGPFHSYAWWLQWNKKAIGWCGNDRPAHFTMPSTRLLNPKGVEKTVKSRQLKNTRRRRIPITVGYKNGAKRAKRKLKKYNYHSMKQTKRLSQELTGYVPVTVRRSSRRPKSELNLERCKILEETIKNCDESHLAVTHFEGKGRGVVCNRQLSRGDFVVEYKGDLVDLDTAAERNAAYAEDSTYGSYMYYFVHRKRKYCVDATLESKYMGRPVNHSSKKPNLCTKTVQIMGETNPRLILFAARQIPIGEELLYDYGERNKDAVTWNPWLLNS